MKTFKALFVTCTLALTLGLTGCEQAEEPTTETPAAAPATAEPDRAAEGEVATTQPATTQPATTQPTTEPAAAATPGSDSYPMDVCVVSGEALGSMGEPIVVMHEGQEVRLCCRGCVDTFNENPDEYVAKVQAAAQAQATDDANGTATP